MTGEKQTANSTKGYANGLVNIENKEWRRARGGGRGFANEEDLTT